MASFQFHLLNLSYLLTLVDMLSLLDRQWESWLPWSSCSTARVCHPAYSQRTRSCGKINSLEGKYCPGDHLEEEPCDANCPAGEYL